MNKLNWLFTIYSLVALVIIIERLSPITRVLLQPYNFIRMHEINQTVIFLTITVIIAVLQLRIITNDFKALKDRQNLMLFLLFTVGVYLFGAGEGWHEVASFTLNSYCNIHKIINQLCGGLYINDFYAGNIIFFIGAVLINTTILALSARFPMKIFSQKDQTILFINSIVYAFTWFAYAAFDEVLVGLFFSALLMLVSLYYFFRIKNNWRAYPYIIYSALAYTLATLSTLLVKFH